MPSRGGQPPPPHRLARPGTARQPGLCHGRAPQGAGASRTRPTGHVHMCPPSCSSSATRPARERITVSKRRNETTAGTPVCHTTRRKTDHDERWRGGGWQARTASCCGERGRRPRGQTCPCVTGDLPSGLPASPVTPRKTSPTACVPGAAGPRPGAPGPPADFEHCLGQEPCGAPGDTASRGAARV